MAVSFVGSASAGNDDGSDPTIDVSGLGLQEGDVVYIGGFAFDGAAAQGIQTAGYSQIAITNWGSITNGFSVFRKVQGGTPDSSIVCNPSLATVSSVYLAMVFRGVDGTTPEDVSATVANNGVTAGDPDPASVDPTTDDCAVVAFGIVGQNTTLTAPAGYGDLDQLAVPSDNINASVAAAWRQLTGSAAEDPGTFNAATNGIWSAATIALRPAAGDTSREAEIDQTLPSLTQSALAALPVTGTASNTLPSISQDAAAAMEAILTGASALPSLTQDATAALGVRGLAASLLPMIRQQAEAAMDAMLTGDSALPAMSQSATAIVGMSATAVSRLGAIEQAAQAQFEAILTGSSQLGSVTQAALAKSDFVATSAGTLPSLSQHLIGWVPGDPVITDTTNLQLPVDFQYVGRPQGDRPISLRGMNEMAAARKLGKMLKF